MTGTKFFLRTVVMTVKEFETMFFTRKGLVIVPKRVVSSPYRTVLMLLPYAVLVDDAGKDNQVRKQEQRRKPQHVSRRDSIFSETEGLMSKKVWVFIKCG